MLVKVITPSNAAIFPEYIIPSIEHLVRDPEVSVRCIYAQSMAPFADTALRYLEMGQALKAHGAFKLSADAQDYDEAQVEVRLGLFLFHSALYRVSQISYDASLQYLQESIEDQLSTLLVDPSPVVKRAVLHNISSLCIFLGRQKTNDVLLSHMITYMNHRDWLLRYAFFESVVDVAACVGGRSLEEYILPLMIQALSGKVGFGEGFGLIHIFTPPDVEESAVAKVLSSLTSLCELGLFQKMRLWELMGATLGFLYHPNIWIRQGKPPCRDPASILHRLDFQVRPHS
jgi:phosphoinositide-3-kinase regulatory subunit 4